MPVAIMDTTSEISLLAPDDGLHETLISAEGQDLYAGLAAAELGFSNEGPEDNWLGTHLYGFVLASKSSNDEFSDSLNNNGVELDNGKFAVPISPTLLSSEEFESLFEEFSADTAISLHMNTSGHSDGELSDSSTHSSQELDDGIFSAPASPALSSNPFKMRPSRCTVVNVSVYGSPTYFAIHNPNPAVTLDPT